MTEDATEGFVGRKMTLEEWADLPEDIEGEFVDGRLEETEMPDSVHEVVAAWLLVLLHGWVIPQGGFVMGSGAKFAVRADRGRMPDLSVYFPGRRPPARGLVHVPPDIMVEIVSPRPRDGRRDRVEKKQEYAEFGARWYWIVDPQLRSLEIYERGADGRYLYALGRSSGVIENVPGCDGLRLDLDELWAAADRLEPNQETPEGEGA
jgi:Uma2 family endonuclease